MSRFDNRRFVYLFDGEDFAGAFDQFTCEDCFGGRKLSANFHHPAAQLLIRRCNIEPRPLRALYVEGSPNGGPARLIDDFGFQYITGVEFNYNPNPKGVLVSVEVKVMKGPRLDLEPRTRKHPALRRLRHLRAKQIF